MMNGPGSTVVFQSASSNLDPSVIDTNGTTDIFFRDTESGRLFMLSSGTNRTAPPFGASDPVISADGRVIAYTLHTAPLGQQSVLALNGPTYAHLKVITNGVRFPTNGIYRSYNPVLSTNGQRVAFKVADNTGKASIYHHDTATGETILVTDKARGNIAGVRDESGPQMNEDGTSLVFEHEALTVRWDLSDRHFTIVSYDQTGTPFEGFSPRFGKSRDTIYFMKYGRHPSGSTVSTLLRRNIGPNPTTDVIHTSKSDVVNYEVGANHTVAVETRSPGANDLNEQADVYLYLGSTSPVLASTSLARVPSGSTPPTFSLLELETTSDPAKLILESAFMPTSQLWSSNLLFSKWLDGGNLFYLDYTPASPGRFYRTRQ
jgi:hypothetical protein